MKGKCSYTVTGVMIVTSKWIISFYPRIIYNLTADAHFDVNFESGHLQNIERQARFVLRKPVRVSVSVSFGDFMSTKFFPLNFFLLSVVHIMRMRMFVGASSGRYVIRYVSLRGCFMGRRIRCY